MTINLVPMLPAESSDLPGSLKADHLILLYLAFLPVGFTMPLQSLAERWALTLSHYNAAPPFHPYPTRWHFHVSRKAVYFLWHFPWDYSHSVLQSTVSYGARTFLFKELDMGIILEAAILPASFNCYFSFSSR